MKETMKDTRQYRSKCTKCYWVAQLISVLLAVSVAASSASSQTPYIDVCCAHSVPIPPDLTIPTDPADWLDWEKTKPWAFQGKLTQNLLQPNQFAGVWTYSHPSLLGACIALPRGSGAPGTLAGFICQSATTGYACFWDSRKRDNNDPKRQVPALGWRGQQLEISKLKDATNLTEKESGVCTDCHRGNNVFLISPDDPTWAKVLRGPLNGPSTGTFTTQVQTQPEHYMPITTLTPPKQRRGWENPVRRNCGACHELPVVGMPGDPGIPPMPPACAGPKDNPDESKCYAPAPTILFAEGKVTFLRVHDVGTGFGHPSDFLDVEVIMKLDSEPDNAFGFQLRNDCHQSAHRGMLDLLQEAFNRNGRVLIDYILTGPRSGGILRVVEIP